MGSPTSLGMVGRNGGVSCWRTLNTTAVTKCKKDIIRGKIKKSGRVSGKADGYPIPRRRVHVYEYVHVINIYYYKLQLYFTSRTLIFKFTQI